MNNDEIINGVPVDPTYYIRNSKLKNQPELELWEFIETNADSRYINDSLKDGANLDKEYVATPKTKLDINEQDFIDYMMNNKDSCQKKYYEMRPYHKANAVDLMNFPASVGYNHRNTTEYNWGLYGNSQQDLKELLGGKAAFDQMNTHYDSAIVRLLVYMPGQVLPWHQDTLNGWCREMSHLNPDYETGYCDIGKIKRDLIMITDWHWGHMLQMENSFFPRWKSGEVYEIPKNVYHLSTNAGLKLKITLNVSGVELS